MSIDAFRDAVESLTSPSSNYFAITPSDNVELPTATKAIYVGQAGDVSVVPLRGSAAVVFRNLQAGSILDVRTQMVKAFGTTAANLVGLA